MNKYTAISVIGLFLVLSAYRIHEEKASTTPNTVEAVEVQEPSWKIPEGTEVIIPKGTIGSAYFTQLEKMRGAYRSGDDATVRQTLLAGMRQGTLHQFSKNTKAKVDTHMGEYIALIPAGIEMKMYFVTDNIDTKPKGKK